eukprot:GHVQ01037052.1.p3 GENE.GHVQ01037052.1~~GHVQ01037052.1.p3  ORF type:complete len:110 (+),score=23.26 GHVQ01037052.1:394-723(+)
MCVDSCLSLCVSWVHEYCLLCMHLGSDSFSYLPQQTQQTTYLYQPTNVYLTHSHSSTCSHSSYRHHTDENNGTTETWMLVVHIYEVSCVFCVWVFMENKEDTAPDKVEL